MSDWLTTTVGEFVKFNYGKSLPERERDKTGKIPVYGSNGIVGYHTKSLINTPSIIIGRKGTIGSVNYSKIPCWAIDTTFFVTELKEGDLLYAYYLLKSLQLHQYNSDSAVPGLNRDNAHSKLINLPPLAEQKAIAHILGTLDDKIELNQRMNRTLEDIARAIFKSWFIDFDPVRAKMEGRQPEGMSKEVADLFCDSFVDSQLGMIPKGWEVGTVRDICEFAYGKSLTKKTRKPGNIPVYGSNGQIDWHNEAIVSSPGIIVGRKGNPGIIKWANTDFYPIDTTFYIVPKSKIKSMYYIFHALSWLDLPSFGADSAVPGLNRNMAYMSHILIPSSNILSFFDNQISSLFNKVFINNEKSRTISHIRDSLLPKLISGEIRVKEAEKIVEEVL